MIVDVNEDVDLIIATPKPRLGLFNLAYAREILSTF